MSAERIVRYTPGVSRPRRDRTDWARVDALTDEEIEQSIKDDPDVAPLLDEEWFRTAKLVMPERKVPIALRIDREVVDWFKAKGPRYQTRMNAVLKAYMKAQQRQAS